MICYLGLNGGQSAAWSNSGSHMSVHAVSYLSYVSRKRDEMLGLPSILSLSRNGFNKFNKTGARMFDFIYC